MIWSILQNTLPPGGQTTSPETLRCDLVKRMSAQLESGYRPRNCLEGTFVAQKETGTL